MINTFKDMFTSKKFLTALTTAVTALATGHPQAALAAALAYVVGQGIADHGKEAAKISAVAQKAASVVQSVAKQVDAVLAAGPNG